MSWQERVDKYKAKREAEQAEVTRHEREAKLTVLREKIPPLLEALDKLNCVEFLTQIRDEIWKAGTIRLLPDLDSITPETPIEAMAVLEAKWPHVEGSGGGTDSDGCSTEIRYEIETAVRGIVIVVKEKNNDALRGAVISVYPFTELFHRKQSASEREPFPAGDPEAESRLEEILIQDTLERQSHGELPYDGVKDKAMVEKFIREKSQAQAEQNLSSARLQRGPLGRFFGKK